MIILSIKLDNFLSHKSTELKFDKSEQVLIDGKSGSGKSSIVEGLVWCLYGHGRSDNRYLVHRGAKKATVTLELRDRGTDYRIIRSVTQKGGRQTISIDSRDSGSTRYSPVKTAGVKETQTFIERDIMRSSYTLFINSVVYPQDNIQSFVRQAAVDRKNLLLEIANAGYFDEYRNKAFELLKKLSVEKVGIETTIGIDAKFIEDNKERVLDITRLEKERTDIEKELKVSQDAMAENDAKLKEHDMKMVDLKYLQGQRSKLELEVGALEVDIKRDNNEYIKLENFDPASVADQVCIVETKKKEYEEEQKKEREYFEWKGKKLRLLDLKPAYLNYDERIAELNRLIIAKMGEKIDECPEIKKPCPIFTERKQNELAAYSKQLEELMVQRREYQEQLDVYLNKDKELGEEPLFSRAKFEELSVVITQAEMEERKKQTLITINEERKKHLIEQITKNTETMAVKGDELSHLKKEMDEKMKGLNSKELHDRARDLKFEHNQIVARHDTNKEQIAVLKEVIKSFEEISVKIKKDKAKLKKIIDQRDALQLLHDAFGSNGLKAIIIDYVLPRLEDKINEILSRLSDFRIRLETQKVAVTSGNSVEGLFISIFNELGEESDYDNYSGGEKLKITVAISEALAELQKAKFRVLDELFIGLDDESTEKFAEIMTALQERFSQMICISHLQNIKDMFPKTITVVKKEGVSQII
ncbi:AAA family ATPase [Candidatus Magnetobacterium casense]|uniref:SMC family ATPase n=1 Tax=Candidatus Magnetobacterium casense TaxID=1455061 RepID=A0ABS6RUJ2_9BACT|nr:SMC family ATPase [Candidatus Magnetobacterium casensis]MBV6340117.1 SMC family ATPase [Candidatus Magnetobacterium casensis]